MRGALSLLVVSILVITTIGSLASSGIAQSAPAPTVTNDSIAKANQSSITPGARLSGIVGVQEAELEGEIHTRSFDIKFKRAETDTKKAAVVKGEINLMQQRFEALQQQKRHLERARNAGEVSRGEYQARVTVLVTRIQTVQRVANASEESAKGLPKGVLESKGIDLSAIQQLKQNARNLTGAEVAAIARSIAGPTIGQGPPAQAGRPVNDSSKGGNVEQTIKRAEQQLEIARQRVTNAEERVDEGGSQNASIALSRANSQLASAVDSLKKARAEFSAGNHSRALKLARQSIDQANAAELNAQEAISQANRGGNQDPNRSGGDQRRGEGNTTTLAGY